MARYLSIVDVTRPRPDVMMVHYEQRNGTDEDYVIEGTGTHGFQAVRYDVAGAVVSETLIQRRARLRAEFDAYAQRIVDQAAAGDAQFESIRSAALGYRFPAES